MQGEWGGACNKVGKREVMRNKFRLKGEKMYVENDLSWEERNTQIKINRSKRAERERIRGQDRGRQSKGKRSLEGMSR